MKRTCGNRSFLFFFWLKKGRRVQCDATASSPGAPIAPSSLVLHLSQEAYTRSYLPQFSRKSPDGLRKSPFQPLGTGLHSAKILNVRSISFSSLCFLSRENPFVTQFGVSLQRVHSSFRPPTCLGATPSFARFVIVRFCHSSWPIAQHTKVGRKLFWHC